MIFGMRSILYIGILICSTGLKAQSTGSVTMHDEAGANALVERYIYFNKEHNQLPGYRIQVIASPKLQDIKDAKSTFLNRYAYKATIVFEAPNYKLRIGNYQNRFEANRDLQEILTDYPNAFICKDLINVSDL
jgi:hypothetical protein